MIQTIVGPPITEGGFTYAGDVTKTGRYVSGRWMHHRVDFQSQGQKREPSRSRGETGAD